MKNRKLFVLLSLLLVAVLMLGACGRGDDEAPAEEPAAAEEAAVEEPAAEERRPRNPLRNRLRKPLPKSLLPPKRLPHPPT